MREQILSTVITVALCLSSLTLHAKESKLKLTKNILYQGNVEKIDDEKVPFGAGVIRVYDINAKDNVLLTIEGQFASQGAVSEAVITWPNGFLFKGDASFSISEINDKETNLKQDIITVKLNNGIIELPQLPSLNLEKPQMDFISSQIESFNITFDLNLKTVTIDYPNYVLVRIPCCSYTNRFGNFKDVEYEGTLARYGQSYEIYGHPTKGTLNDNKGFSYSGTFTDLSLYENGEYKDVHGNTYVGSFKTTSDGINMFNKGKITLSNGDTASGEFSGSTYSIVEARMIDVSCQWHFPSGYYEGIVKNDNFSQGKLITLVGDTLSGVWVNKEFHTGTTNITHDGIYIGKWDGGYFVNGTINGDVKSSHYEGVFTDNGKFFGKCSIKDDPRYPFSQFNGEMKADTLSGAFTFVSFPIMNNDGRQLLLDGNCSFIHENDKMSGSWDNGVCQEAEIHFGKIVSEDDSNVQYSGVIVPKNDAYQVIVSRNSQPFKDYSLKTVDLYLMGMIIDSVKATRTEQEDAIRLEQERMAREREEAKSKTYYKLDEKGDLAEFQKKFDNGVYALFRNGTLELELPNGDIVSGPVFRSDSKKVFQASTFYYSRDRNDLGVFGIYLDQVKKESTCTVTTKGGDVYGVNCNRDRRIETFEIQMESNLRLTGKSYGSSFDFSSSEKLRDEIYKNVIEGRSGAEVSITYPDGILLYKHRFYYLYPNGDKFESGVWDDDYPAKWVLNYEKVVITPTKNNGQRYVPDFYALAEMPSIASLQKIPGKLYKTDGSIVVYDASGNIDEFESQSQTLKAAASIKEKKERLEANKKRIEELEKKYGKSNVTALFNGRMPSGASYKLLEEFFSKEKNEEINREVEVALWKSIDHGSSVCYDFVVHFWNHGWYSSTKGFIWVSNGKVSSVVYR